jgi:hypothetical protein
MYYLHAYHPVKGRDYERYRRFHPSELSGGDFWKDLWKDFWKDFWKINKDFWERTFISSSEALGWRTFLESWCSLSMIP